MAKRTGEASVEYLKAKLVRYLFERKSQVMSGYGLPVQVCGNGGRNVKICDS